MKPKIKLASQDFVDQYAGLVDEILYTIEIPSALITDESSLCDFASDPKDDQKLLFLVNEKFKLNLQTTNITFPQLILLIENKQEEIYTKPTVH